MSNFTSGPWVRSTHGFNIVSRPAAWEQSRSVCAVHPDGATAEEHSANADLIADAPLLIQALARAVLDGRETDKWQDHAERTIAHALGFKGTYDRKALYARMHELRQSWGTNEPILPTWADRRTA